jgi:hypothetical protein
VGVKAVVDDANAHRHERIGLPNLAERLVREDACPDTS